MRQPKLLATLPGYDRNAFAADLFAGVTVAMVALPLSIAIAIASGATPAQGLVTAVVAGFLVSALGGSRVQIGGPTGAFIVVVYGVIQEHGHDGLLLATLMAGLILLVAGWLRAGRLIAMVPDAVIEGFTIGIAIIIATSQIKDLAGLSAENLPADFLEKVPALWAARESLSPLALAVGVGTIALIALLRRVAPRLPALLLAVAAFSAFVAATGMPVETVAERYGELPRGLPAPELPRIDLERLGALLPSALVIAFLAGIESLLSAIVADRMFGGAHRPNAELIAQGAANLGSSLFGGLPATGAIARTATNVRAGGRTPVAGIVHALTILLAMLVFAPLAGRMALPALAGLLILAAWTMSEPEKWRQRLAARPTDRFLLFLTMALTVLADLTVAIGVGVAIGLAIRLQRRDVPPAEHDPRRE